MNYLKPVSKHKLKRWDTSMLTLTLRPLESLLSILEYKVGKIKKEMQLKQSKPALYYPDAK